MYQQNSVIVLQAGKQVETSHSLEYSENMIHPTLLGNIHEHQETLNLVSLSEILPIKVVQLLQYIYHLYVMELQRKKLYVETISLNTIKVSKNMQSPFVYLMPKQGNVSEAFLTKQIQMICFSLQFPFKIYTQQCIKQITVNVLNHFFLLKGVKQTQLKLYKEIANFQQHILEFCQISNKHNSHVKQCQNSRAYVGIVQKPQFLHTSKEKIFVKIIKKEFEYHHLREIQIMEWCNLQPRMARLYGYFRYQDILITFQKVHNNTLNHFNAKIMQKLKENKITEMNVIKIQETIFQKLVKTVSYFHENHIIHRDLKPENVMLDYKNENELIEDPQKLKIILIDFDNSIFDHKECIQESQSFQSNYTGTQIYAPPEIAESNEYYSNKVDIYQLGLIFLQMTKECKKLYSDYKKRPIDEKKFKEFINKITQHQNVIHHNEKLINLFLKMISFNQNQRPNAQEILQQIQTIAHVS